MPLAPLLAIAAATWFGPAQATFPVTLPGNPYDFRANDVRVVFVSENGHREERLGYFVDGTWLSRLTTTHPGRYTARLFHNGTPIETVPVEVNVKDFEPLAGGFVRIQGSRFVTDAGQPYFPIGHNLGWHYSGTPELDRQLEIMGGAGMNWSRIWACHWDGKNPFMFRIGTPDGAPLESVGPPLGELMPDALQQWERLVGAAEQAGIRFQLVLFHHGLFSSQVNTCWEEHPWNMANGGFLDRPHDFFTDPRARDYAQRWLRYAIARWGHSPSILAWELFNEVEWVDPVHIDHDWEAVARWHAEMASFIRELDPYKHLITTSSATEHPPLYDAMDYFQPHIYTKDVFVGIGGSRPLSGKPWFFGEFGGSAYGPEVADEHLIARNGIWASLLFGHSGAAGYWYWERVERQHFAHEFTRATRALELSGLPTWLAPRPLPVEVAGAHPAPLVLTPGLGWAENRIHVFNLPQDASPAGLGGFSSYLKGPDLAKGSPGPPPVRIRFTTNEPIEVTIALASAGGKGSGLQVLLDGRGVAFLQWTPADQAYTGLAPIVVPCDAGDHELILKSQGPDWVQLGHITFPGLGRTSQAFAITDGDSTLVRVTTHPDHLPARLDLGLPGVTDGDHTLHVLDLETGGEEQRRASVHDAKLHSLQINTRDAALILRR